MNKDEQIVHQYWVVAFIDVLGQRAKMKAIDFVPLESDATQMDGFMAGIKKVYGAVNFIQKSFENWAKGYHRHAKDSTILAELTDDQRALADTMRSPPLRFQRFSDGLMIYISLADCHERSPIAGVYSLFGACATVLLSSLAAHTPVRGGIDVGTGVEMAPGELYGPVVARAYELESAVAQYPRIVVGPGCLAYLKAHETSKEVGHKAEFEKEMAQVCSALLMVDVDGHAAVDYLGEGFKRYIAANLDHKLFDMAREYIIGQLEDGRKNHDTKLALRYCQLLNYIEARAHLWAKQ